MLVPQKQNGLHTPILLALIATGLTVLVATSLGKELVKTVTDVMYIPIAGIFVASAAMMVLRFGRTGSHGKAWLFILGAAISWFLAETLWTVFELAYNENPFPSVADVFYLIGYPLFFAFLVYYLKPIRNAISKKMLVTAIIISASVAVPSMYIAYSFDPTTTLTENVLSTAYPIGDAVILVPALIGISLFFRGEVSFSWSLVCIGIIFFAAGDIGFQFTTFTNTYYTGHPVDILLMWSYIMFTFGVIDNYRIFKKEKTVVDKKGKYSYTGI